jgi:hypothetical protein
MRNCVFPDLYSTSVCIFGTGFRYNTAMFRNHWIVSNRMYRVYLLAQWRGKFKRAHLLYVMLTHRESELMLWLVVSPLDCEAYRNHDWSQNVWRMNTLDMTNRLMNGQDSSFSINFCHPFRIILNHQSRKCSNCFWNVNIIISPTCANLLVCLSDNKLLYSICLPIAAKCNYLKKYK